MIEPARMIGIEKLAWSIGPSSLCRKRLGTKPLARSKPRLRLGRVKDTSRLSHQGGHR